VTTPGPRRGWLTRNVAVLSAVSFLQDTASELLYPILPIFLTVTLGAPAAVVGLVEGVAEGAASVTKLAAGSLVARYPRRRLVGVGYGLAAVGKLVVALAPGWGVVLGGRALDRLGKGMRGAPRDALLVDDVPVGRRGRVFGFHRTADTLGAVLGPLLGLAAYQALDHRLRPVLLLAVVPAVASVALVLVVRDPRPPRRAAADGVRAGLLGVLRPPANLPRSYWRVVAVVTGFALVNFPDALLLLRLHQIGFSVTAVILAYVGYNAVYAAASLPAGALADRIGPPAVFGLGLVFFSIGYLGLGLTRDHLGAWLLLAVYGLFAACTDGVGKAWVSGLLDAESQSAGQGYLQGLSGLAVLLAGSWAGAAWGAAGMLPLVLSGSVAAVLAVGLITVGRPASRAGAAPAAATPPGPPG
jgi:MFS family permease